uniref:Uncharacterized protein n=1 Tax=Thermofilum pendens TaxID=2269 RepID=A0A7C4BAP9_THEPE
MRGKRRYVVLKYMGGGEVSAGEVLNRVRALLTNVFGLMGLIDTDPALVYSWEGRVFVVAVKREGLEKFLASLVFDATHSIRVLKVVGTFRRAKRLVRSMQK